MRGDETALLVGGGTGRVARSRRRPRTRLLVGSGGPGRGCSRTGRHRTRLAAVGDTGPGPQCFESERYFSLSSLLTLRATNFIFYTFSFLS
ncbi:hypothetical protein PAHAL_9G229700 [Panicum hallii]|uniref:Uncharacterized protein n=1 Tax=Panicum hallii TaxID=206008 RepID=A0A2S3ILS4_9POAL|nr:hypothetical protein PAHAL_9G229700 [Panicum hallii]